MHHSNGLLGRGRFGCAGAVRGGRPSPEPSFTSLQQTLTARPWSAHQAREPSLSVGECDRGVDIIPLTVWPLTFMLALKAVPHGCRHLLFASMCSTIPTSPDSGLTSQCGWTAKANPPMKWCRDTICFHRLIACLARDRCRCAYSSCSHNPPPPLHHPSSGCRMATHFVLAHKAVPHGCRHLLFTTMCSTIPTSPAMIPVSPHGAAGQQPPPRFTISVLFPGPQRGS